MSLLTPDDFVGKWSISQAFNDGGIKLQTYIDFYESKYLNELFGAELNVLFLAGYNNVQIYTVLFDPFAFDSDCLKQPFVSNGIKDMLKSFVYAHYLRQDLGTSTSAGHVNLQPEGGTKIDDNYNSTFAYYNEGVKTYKAIQQFIKENSTDYPEFKGIEKRLTWFI